MFGNILVPLDGSPLAEQALPYALAIARRAQARLDLVRVHVLYALQVPAYHWAPYDPAMDAACKQQEQLYLDATAKWLKAEAPLAISASVIDGLTVDGLLGRIHADRPDLVVMTTHGHNPVNRFFLGSTADELLRRTTVPLLVIQPQERAPQTIPEPALANMLVPLDGSGLAEQMLGPAVVLARLMEGRCTLLRVVESRDVRPGSAVHLAEAAAQEYLERIAQRLQAQDCPVHTKVVVAQHAALAILEQAQGSDVIALATHGRGGVRRMLLGSVADKVIRGASVPVLVYRPPAE